MKHVWITTRPPTNGDAGAGEIGFYEVEDGYLQMFSEDGKAGKKVKLAPGDDPRTIAGRLTKEAWMKRARESTFNRPLVYPKIGLA
jgi:hypothetical protein